MRYLLLSLSLASLASALLCLGIWFWGQASSPSRAVDPFELGRPPIMPAR